MNDQAENTTIHGGVIACHECDLIHYVEQIPKGRNAHCRRCGSVLWQHIPNSLDRTLALNLAALACFIAANLFPFLSLEIAGRVESNVFIASAIALFHEGMGGLGLLVFLTSTCFPFLTIIGMLYMLLPLKFSIRPPGLARVYRFIRAISPWSMLSVLMLGILLAIVKLQDMATIIPGISLYAFIALLITHTAANVSFSASVLWPMGEADIITPGGGETAAQQGLIHCHACSLLAPEPEPGRAGLCPRCASPLHRRKANSLERTWALIFTAALLMIPANIYPIMTVIRFGQGDPSTILNGVIHLIAADMWPLAMIVFFASILVPVIKLITLSFLAISVQRKSTWRPRDRTVLYRVSEGIGSWSMVDIFLIAILTSLVSLDALATIRPGIGAIFFAGVVVTTIFAARSFDPRLIWDNYGKG